MLPPLMRLQNQEKQSRMIAESVGQDLSKVWARWRGGPIHFLGQRGRQAILMRSPKPWPDFARLIKPSCSIFLKCLGYRAIRSEVLRTIPPLAR
jgi:hypothetical protein